MQASHPPRPRSETSAVRPGSPRAAGPAPPAARCGPDPRARGSREGWWGQAALGPEAQAGRAAHRGGLLRGSQAALLRPSPRPRPRGLRDPERGYPAQPSEGRGSSCRRLGGPGPASARQVLALLAGVCHPQRLSQSTLG
nr:proline-rich protein 34-like [Saimiri boliviensis boliviensis]